MVQGHACGMQYTERMAEEECYLASYIRLLEYSLSTEAGRLQWLRIHARTWYPMYNHCMPGLRSN